MYKIYIHRSGIELSKFVNYTRYQIIICNLLKKIEIVNFFVKIIYNFYKTRLANRIINIISPTFLVIDYQYRFVNRVKIFIYDVYCI